MSSELEQQVQGLIAVPRQDKALVTQARGIRQSTELAVFETKGTVIQAAATTDAIMALAARTMESVTDLDAHRRSLANGDQTLNMLLGEIEVTAVRQAQSLQRQTFSRFGV